MQHLLSAGELLDKDGNPSCFLKIKHRDRTHSI